MSSFRRWQPIDFENLVRELKNRSDDQIQNNLDDVNFEIAVVLETIDVFHNCVQFNESAKT